MRAQIGNIDDELFADIENSIINVPQTLAEPDEGVPEHIRTENAYIQKDLCYANDPNVIDWFLENGYNINEWGISGHTPLHYQLLRNDRLFQNVVQLLFQLQKSYYL